jgi:predicted  nucleic acid-binding Zn ribbon protein
MVMRMKNTKTHQPMNTGSSILVTPVYQTFAKASGDVRALQVWQMPWSVRDATLGVLLSPTFRTKTISLQSS